MGYSKSERDFLISELSRELGAKRDGGNKNLIARCPACGKDGKFGVFIGKETERKKLFMSHCFSCGFTTYTLDVLLDFIGRPDLKVSSTVDLSGALSESLLFPLDGEEEIEDSLCVIELPDFYRRSFSHPYLRSRGFVFDDYEYFPVGCTGKLNVRFRDYVIFPIVDSGDVVGYVSRHVFSKDEIDLHNRRAKLSGDYKIMRFRNSTENDFVRLLYNYDSVVEDETDTVILVEGIFDVIALTRTLELYDCSRIVPVATFGKKVSLTQIYKLQCKGVETVVIGYDGDAVEAIKKTSSDLSPYFQVVIADIPFSDKDWEDMSFAEVYDVFAYGLKTPLEYSINKIQQ